MNPPRAGSIPVVRPGQNILFVCFFKRTDFSSPILVVVDASSMKREGHFFFMSGY